MYDMWTSSVTVLQKSRGTVTNRETRDLLHRLLVIRKNPMINLLGVETFNKTAVCISLGEGT